MIGPSGEPAGGTTRSAPVWAGAELILRWSDPTWGSNYVIIQSSTPVNSLRIWQKQRFPKLCGVFPRFYNSSTVINCFLTSHNPFQSFRPTPPLQECPRQNPIPSHTADDLVHRPSAKIPVAPSFPSTSSGHLPVPGWSIGLHPPAPPSPLSPHPRIHSHLSCSTLNPQRDVAEQAVAEPADTSVGASRKASRLCSRGSADRRSWRAEAARSGKRFLGGFHESGTFGDNETKPLGSCWAYWLGLAKGGLQLSWENRKGRFQFKNI